MYAVVGYFFIQAAIAFKSTTAKGPSGALIELADTTWGKVLLWIIADRAVRLRRLLHRRGQVPQGGMKQDGRRQTSRSGREPQVSGYSVADRFADNFHER